MIMSTIDNVAWPYIQTQTETAWQHGAKEHDHLDYSESSFKSVLVDVIAFLFHLIVSFSAYIKRSNDVYHKDR